MAGKWEFPGGKLEPNETPEECLQRELMEELSIQTRIGSFIGESIYEYDHGAIKLIGYEVEHLSGEFVLTVHDDMKWVGVGELLEYDLAPADVPLITILKERFND